MWKPLPSTHVLKTSLSICLDISTCLRSIETIISFLDWVVVSLMTLVSLFHVVSST